MLKKDPLHLVSLMLTSIAALFQFIAVLLPNWWVLKDYYMKTTVTTFNIFEHVRCNDTVCFPDDVKVVPVPEGVPPPTGFTGDNAGWLTAGRILIIIGLVSISGAVILQLIFLKVNYRSLQVLVDCFLINAAVANFIAGFLFLGKYFVLSKVYVGQRPLGALTYTAAAPGCVLFSSILCAVAAVFTTLAFRPPRKNRAFMHTT